MKVVWFSAGASSAVALKLTDDVDLAVYIHIEDQHEDTLRFVRDVSDWTGVDIAIWTPPLKNVENACLAAGGRGYINGPVGAACTERLKRRPRKAWEQENPGPHVYVWGIDAGEAHRADRIRESMPKHDHEFPLIEHDMSKGDAHKTLNASGIKRPAMYDLGYPNNNCIGCVKGGMGYWNKIRQDFPEVFAARAAMEQRVGATCGKVALADLAPDRGRDLKPIVDDCGIFCELISL
jgi:3'-phosphoadenosine 5'-phosphosulfate sulfotransferase (PAPS reductase)/FAD synthetase